jgi:hypothetical protein
MEHWGGGGISASVYKSRDISIEKMEILMPVYKAGDLNARKKSWRSQQVDAKS